MNKRSAALLFVAALIFSSIPFIGAAQTTSAPKPQCTLKASTYALQKGNTVNLTWSSINAASGTITSIGPVAPQGVQGVIPTQTTTYTGTFNGPGGSVKCVVTVAVVIPPGSSTVTGGVGDTGTGGGTTNGTGGGINTGVTPPTGTGVVAIDPVSPGTGKAPAGSIVPCNGVLCQMCDLVKLSQNIINFLIGLSIPLAAALFAWAGVLFFTSSAVDKIAKARSILTNALIGFLIAISAWLVVQTIMKAILSDKYYQGWNRIECVADSARQTKGTVAQLLGTILPGLNTSPLTPSSYPLNPYNPGGVMLTPPPGGGCDEGLGVCWDKDNNIVNASDGSVANATQAYYGANTSMGPDGGNLACAWAVNNILKSAGIPAVDGDSVYLMEAELQKGRGTYVDTSNAQPGDIIVWSDKTKGVSHVGICQNAGCSQTLSNSSGSATFTAQLPSTWRDVPGRVYRVNR